MKSKITKGVILAAIMAGLTAAVPSLLEAGKAFVTAALASVGF